MFLIYDGKVFCQKGCILLTVRNISFFLNLTFAWTVLVIVSWDKLRLDNNIGSVTLNNTYLNIVLFSQVGVTSKILNSIIFNFFEFIEYFQDVKFNVIESALLQTLDKFCENKNWSVLVDRDSSWKNQTEFF